MIVKIKHIIGANGYWSINKELAKILGLDATILLQHLIDLQESFFENGNFYQQQERLLEDLPLKLKAFRNARKVLEDKNLITYKRGYQAKYYYTVVTNNVLQLLGINCDSSKSYSSNSSNSDSSNSSNNNCSIAQTLKIKNTKNKDTNSDATRQDGKKKPDIEILLDKIIERYPGSINSRGPMLKALKQLDTEERKLALKNIDRYTKAWEGYHHNLRNYLESKQFSESELSKRETKKNKPSSTVNPNHNFSGDYGKIIEDNLEWDF